MRICFCSDSRINVGYERLLHEVEGRFAPSTFESQMHLLHPKRWSVS